MKHGTNLFWRINLVWLAVLDLTEWTAWSRRMGIPLFFILEITVYLPGAFFGWRYSFNAHALDAFNGSGLIATSSGVATDVVALTEFILRIRREPSTDLCNVGPLSLRGGIRDLTQCVHAVVAPRNPQFSEMLAYHIRQKSWHAC
jgi:hypothetical protein